MYTSRIWSHIGSRKVAFDPLLNSQSAIYKFKSISNVERYCWVQILNFKMTHIYNTEGYDKGGTHEPLNRSEFFKGDAGILDPQTDESARILKMRFLIFEPTLIFEPQCNNRYSILS